MRIFFVVFILIFYFIINSNFCQEIVAKKPISQNIKDSPQATGDDIKIKDDESNTLVRVIDKGSFGSIELKIGVPSTTTNKLYNNSGTFHFNRTALGS